MCRSCVGWCSWQISLDSYRINGILSQFFERLRFGHLSQSLSQVALMPGGSQPHERRPDPVLTRLCNL